MAKPILIPSPPASGAFRLRPRGRHAKGHAPKLSFSHPINPGYLPGDSKARQAKAATQAEFLAESQREAVRLARGKATARDYRAFFETLTPAEQKFARAHGLDRPLSDSTRPESSDALDHCGDDERPEPIPEAGVRGCHNGRPLVSREHPVLDELEPEHLSVDLDQLSPAEIEETSGIIDRALRWALDGGDLVEKGRRSIVIIVAMRTDLAAGLEIDRQLAVDFIAELRCDTRAEVQCVRTALAAAGRAFDRFLEWMRRGSSLSAIGERLEMVAYILRPDLIDSATLAKLGEATNKSRQAKDKGANCFRDTFASLKALAMRPDITRLRCQLAHATGGGGSSGS